MTVIRVNPPTIFRYAEEANEIFAAVRTTLDSLVEEAIGVNYKGPNAVEFKTTLGTMAVEFANALNTDIARIAEAISSATTAIATSLGGQPVALHVNVAPFSMPAIPADDGSVELDTSGLSAFGTSARSQFQSISAAFDTHLGALQGTDWEGTAKTQAVSAVTSYTGQAQTSVDETTTRITGYVDDQVTATLTADVA